MVSIKLYTATYVVLFVSTTAQILAEFVGLSHWLAFGAIMVLSAAKVVLVAACFQYLRFEPRSLTCLVCIGLMATLALMLVVSYSLL